MKHYLQSILALLLVALVAWIIIVTPRPIAPTAGDLSELTQTYTNTAYGFTLRHPQANQPEFTFIPYYHLPTNWRSGAVSAGTPIVAIPVIRLVSEKSYPRYFTAELRIGASNDPTEVKNCYQNDQVYKNIPAQDVMLNGYPFKKFIIDGAAMMQYVRGVSYRTIRNGSCIAIEQLATGSNYRDDPWSAGSIQDDVLNDYFDSIDNIVQTFTFTDATGLHCGGFIKDAPTCPAGYHCQLKPMADLGGTCVKD